MNNGGNEGRSEKEIWSLSDLYEAVREACLAAASVAEAIRTKVPAEIRGTIDSKTGEGDDMLGDAQDVYDQTAEILQRIGESRIDYRSDPNYGSE